MKLLLIAFMLCLSGCLGLTTAEGQHRLGAIIATVYKYKENSMPIQYRAAAKIAYRVLSIVTAGQEKNDLESINALIDKYGAIHQLEPEQIALAKVTFSQVYARAKLEGISERSRLERLRHIKSGIDSIAN